MIVASTAASPKRSLTSPARRAAAALVTTSPLPSVTSATAAREAGELRLRFGDAAVDATITNDDDA